MLTVNNPDRQSLLLYRILALFGAALSIIGWYRSMTYHLLKTQPQPRTQTSELRSLPSGDRTFRPTVPCRTGYRRELRDPTGLSAA